MGVPIGTSVGAPSWMPGLDYITAFKPVGLVKIQDRDEFTEKYRARLDKMAGAAIRDLDALSRKYPDTRLVMLCYEDITKPGVWCHREVLAEWLREKGLEVPEIPADRADAAALGLAPGPVTPAPPATAPAEPEPPSLW
jgi:uncharacterized protein (DUF488 family)